MPRPTLQYDRSEGNWTEGFSGPYAVGPVLRAAGSRDEEFNILADPKVAAEVVALLRQRTIEDDAKQNAPGGFAS